jgi:hypothetical protein
MFTSTTLAAILILAVTNNESNHYGAKRKLDVGSDVSENEHRKIERYYWKAQLLVSLFSLIVTGLAFSGAVLGVYIAYKAYLTAVKQVDVASDTEKRQLRAYVFLSSISIDGQYIKAKMKNEGQTAAFNITHWWTARSFHLPVAHSDLLEYQDTIPGFSVDLGPQGDHDLNPIGELTNKVTQSDVTAADQGKEEIYVWGLIKYRDIFVRCQSTQFAYMHYMHQWYIVKEGHSSTDPPGKEGCSADKDPKSTYKPPNIYLIDSK